MKRNFFTVRVYKIIHSEQIATPNGEKTIRVCAITDPELFRMKRINDEYVARIEIQKSGSAYEVLGKYDSIVDAHNALPKLIEKQTSKIDVNQLLDELARY